jgi:pimeloyl-ACP methyl ester carboxylesterase
MERLEARALMAADETLGTARQLGALGQFSGADTVGPADVSDFYRFSLAAAGNVTVTLRNLSANADLELIQDKNNNGVVDSGEKLRLSYESGTSRDWISDGLAAGSNYYVRVFNPSGSSASPAYTLDVVGRAYAASGFATRGSEQALVGFERLDGSTTPINPNASTWIVAHGRVSGPQADNIARLSAAVDGFQAGDQVLLLDWSSVVRKAGTTTTSSLSDYLGEGWIPYVASFVATKLTSLGFGSGNLINLAGHSWGAVLSGEIANRMRAPGSSTVFGVNRIVALDPARDSSIADPNIYNLAYNPENVNFAANSRFARAFFSSSSSLIGSIGSATSSATADETFRVNVGSGTAAHSNVVTLFSKMLERNNAGSPDAVSALFGLGTMSTSVVKPWKLNAYSSSGGLSSTGKFEGVLDGTLLGGDWVPQRLRYVSSTTQLEVTVLA